MQICTNTTAASSDLSPLVVDDPNAERYEALWHSAAEAAYRGDSEALEFSRKP